MKFPKGGGRTMSLGNSGGGGLTRFPQMVIPRGGGGGFQKTSFRGAGADIFWYYTIEMARTRAFFTWI